MPSSAVQTSALDRKSTRLNSSHTLISYAVFCLKKIIVLDDDIPTIHPIHQIAINTITTFRFRLLAQLPPDPLARPACRQMLVFLFFFFKETRHPRIPPLPPPPPHPR